MIGLKGHGGIIVAAVSMAQCTKKHAHVLVESTKENVKRDFIHKDKLHHKKDNSGGQNNSKHTSEKEDSPLLDGTRGGLSAVCVGTVEMHNNDKERRDFITLDKHKNITHSKILDGAKNDEKKCKSIDGYAITDSSTQRNCELVSSKRGSNKIHSVKCDSLTASKEHGKHSVQKESVKDNGKHKKKECEIAKSSSSADRVKEKTSNCFNKDDKISNVNEKESIKTASNNHITLDELIEESHKEIENQSTDSNTNEDSFYQQSKYDLSKPSSKSKSDDSVVENCTSGYKTDNEHFRNNYPHNNKEQHSPPESNRKDTAKKVSDEDNRSKYKDDRDELKITKDVKKIITNDDDVIEKTNNKDSTEVHNMTIEANSDHNSGDSCNEFTNNNKGDGLSIVLNEKSSKNSYNKSSKECVTDGYMSDNNKQSTVTQENIGHGTKMTSSEYSDEKSVMEDIVKGCLGGAVPNEEENDNRENKEIEVQSSNDCVKEDHCRQIKYNITENCSRHKSDRSYNEVRDSAKDNLSTIASSNSVRKNNICRNQRENEFTTDTCKYIKKESSLAHNMKKIVGKCSNDLTNCKHKNTKAYIEIDASNEKIAANDGTKERVKVTLNKSIELIKKDDNYKEKKTKNRSTSDYRRRKHTLSETNSQHKTDKNSLRICSSAKSFLLGKENRIRECEKIKKHINYHHNEKQYNINHDSVANRIKKKYSHYSNRGNNYGYKSKSVIVCIKDDGHRQRKHATKAHSKHRTNKSHSVASSKYNSSHIPSEHIRKNGAHKHIKDKACATNNHRKESRIRDKSSVADKAKKLSNDCSDKSKLYRNNKNSNTIETDPNGRKSTYKNSTRVKTASNDIGRTLKDDDTKSLNCNEEQNNCKQDNSSKNDSDGTVRSVDNNKYSSGHNSSTSKEFIGREGNSGQKRKYDTTNDHKSGNKRVCHGKNDLNTSREHNNRISDYKDDVKSSSGHKNDKDSHTKGGIKRLTDKNCVEKWERCKRSEHRHGNRKRSELSSSTQTSRKHAKHKHDVHRSHREKIRTKINRGKNVQASHPEHRTETSDREKKETKYRSEGELSSSDSEG